MTVDPMLIDMLRWVLTILAVGVFGWVVISIKEEFDDDDRLPPGGAA